MIIGIGLMLFKWQCLCMHKLIFLQVTENILIMPWNHIAGQGMFVEEDCSTLKMDFGGEMQILFLHLQKKMGMIVIGVEAMDGFTLHLQELWKLLEKKINIILNY